MKEILTYFQLGVPNVSREEYVILGFKFGDTEYQEVQHLLIEPAMKQIQPGPFGRSLGVSAVPYQTVLFLMGLIIFFLQMFISVNQSTIFSCYISQCRESRVKNRTLHIRITCLCYTTMELTSTTIRLLKEFDLR